MPCRESCSGFVVRILVLFLIGYLCLFAGIADALTILAPDASKILVNSRRSFVHMVIRSSGKVNAGRIVVEKETGQGRINPLGSWQGNNGYYFLHYILPLKSGMNIFMVEPGKRRIRIRYRPLATLLNYNSSASSAYHFHRQKVVPVVCSGCHSQGFPGEQNILERERIKCKDFSPVCYSCHRRLADAGRWRHSPSFNLYCLGCHEGNKGRGDIVVIQGRVDDTCLRCHVNGRKWKKMGHIHGPVGVGDCTVCHDPHGARYKYQLWADGKAALCVACHADKKRLISGTPLGFHVHGIVKGGGCTICHSPHATENIFQLLEPINKLCVGCHVTMKGIIVGHPVGGHPVKGPRDPRRPGRRFGCTSCHNPHGSNYAYLLIGDLLGGHVCSKCHH